jgi:uncharacterized protein
MPSKPLSESAAFRAAHDWPLPAAPYLPGMTARPEGDDDVHRVAAMAPDPTEPNEWRENAAYLAGFRLYNAGFGWEAHEAWEPVWMHARAHSAERHLLQGLIQLANARLKLAMDRPKAVRRLAGMALDCLHQARFVGGSTVMGVDVGEVATIAGEIGTGVSGFRNMHYNA